MIRLIHILLMAVAICLSSCQKLKDRHMALAEADSLYAIAQKSLDNYPAVRSLLYYQRAVDAVETANDNASLNLKMKIFRDMGKLFAEQQLYNEAVNRFRFSYDCALIIRDTLGMALALQGIGDTYHKLNDTEEAMRNFNKAEQLAVKSANKDMEISIAWHKASVYAESNRIDKLIELLPTPPYKVAKDDEDVFNYVMAYIYETPEYQQIDSVNYYLNKLSETDSPHYRQFVINQRLQHAIQQKDYRQIDQLFHQKKALDQELEYISQDKANGSVGALYQALNSEREKSDMLIKSQQTKFYTIITILCLILGIAISGVQLYRMRSERMRLERNNALLEKYNNSLQSDLEMERAKATVSQSYADSKIIQIRESDICQRLYKSVKPINEADMAEVTALVNRLYPDFSTRLAKLGVVKDHEVRMCYLIKMGLKTSRLAILLSRTDSAISNGRMRLYKKVFGVEGKGEDWDKVIKSL